MILQSEKVIEYIDNLMILGLVIIFLVFINTFIIIEIMSRHRNKVHNSYHKGFRDSMNENVKYYKVIKDLKDSFKEIYDKLYSEQTEMKVELAELLIDYKDKLIEYENK